LFESLVLNRIFDGYKAVEMSHLSFTAYVNKRQLVSYALVAFVIGSMLGVSMWDIGGIYTPEPPLTAISTSGSLRRFASYDELKTFLSTRPTHQSVRAREGIATQVSGLISAISPAKTESVMEDSLGGQDFSGTNIQVEGVDEADLVKTS